MRVLRKEKVEGKKEREEVNQVERGIQDIKKDGGVEEKKGKKREKKKGKKREKKKGKKGSE